MSQHQNGGLTDAQRRELGALLDAELERTAAREAALVREFDDIVTASADAVRDDEHDPEGATIAFERAQVAALLADARAQLVAIEQAGALLHDDGYGRCDRCGGPIAFERLLARPTATRCVRCAGT